jgi:hypothetical protein
MLVTTALATDGHVEADEDEFELMMSFIRIVVYG